MKTGGRATVAVNRCGSYDKEELAGAITGALEPFGGMREFAGAGRRVLLKPNMLSAKDPSRAITTHPLFVEAVIDLVREAGGEPVIGDSPGGAVRGIRRVWDNTMMSDLAGRTSCELVNFEASGTETVDTGICRFFVARPVLEADAVINLPKLKTHSLTLLTCAVKNMFGVLPGFRKAEMHKLFPKPAPFSRMLVELYRNVRPALNIVDGVMAMEGDGPSSGKPRLTGIVAAGTDAVAVDAVMARVIGFDPAGIDTIRIAGEEGLGTADPSLIDVTGDAADYRDEGFSLPSNTGMRLIPGPLARLVAPLVWLRLEIDEEACTSCGMCYRSCPVKAVRKRGEGFAIDRDECVRCMCCHELCPENAIEIKLSWLARKFI